MRKEIQDAFGNHMLKSATWLSVKTEKKLQKKLSKMKFEIGYFNSFQAKF